jgi:hypothetical protein
MKTKQKRFVFWFRFLLWTTIVLWLLVITFGVLKNCARTYYWHEGNDDGMGSWWTSDTQGYEWCIRYSCVDVQKVVDNWVDWRIMYGRVETTTYKLQSDWGLFVAVGNTESFLPPPNKGTSP